MAFVVNQESVLGVYAFPPSQLPLLMGCVQVSGACSLFMYMAMVCTAWAMLGSFTPWRLTFTVCSWLRPEPPCNSNSIPMFVHTAYLCSGMYTHLHACIWVDVVNNRRVTSCHTHCRTLNHYTVHTQLGVREVRPLVRSCPEAAVCTAQGGGLRLQNTPALPYGTSEPCRTDKGDFQKASFRFGDLDALQTGCFGAPQESLILLWLGQPGSTGSPLPSYSVPIELLSQHDCCMLLVR